MCFIRAKLTLKLVVPYSSVNSSKMHFQTLRYMCFVRANVALKSFVPHFMDQLSVTGHFMLMIESMTTVITDIIPYLLMDRINVML